MWATLPVIVIWSAAVTAAEPKCGKWDKDWNKCKTVSDCALASDECGTKRIAVNKSHVAKVNKFFTCGRSKENCSSAKDAAFDSPMKCEAYTVKFANAKPPEAMCMRLADIVSMAINNDDKAKVEAAINETKDVDMPLSHIHETPLSLAALNAKSDLIVWLLGKGAKVNFQTKNGYTALMFAAMARVGDKKTVTDSISALLKAGADKTLRNSRGQTALDEATEAGNEDAVNLLK